VININIFYKGKPLGIKPEGVSLRDFIVDKIGDNPVLLRCGSKVQDLLTPITEDSDCEIIKYPDKNVLSTFWHTSSHILAQAVKRLFPTAKLGIGPAIENGFYYDFFIDKPFTEEDIPRIEEEMKKIVDADYQLEREDMSKKDANKLFSEKGENFKVELIRDIQGDKVSVYKQGDFIDLCKGPHISSTGLVKNIKLLSFASAYWHGDEDKPSMQRIYGITFFERKELKSFLIRYAEAKKRDHRKLGKALDLFSIYPEAGAGLVFWHPKGAVIRKVIEDFWIDEHRKRGYELVYTPHIAKSDLWKISGHFDYYKENMYYFQIDNEEFVVKPMNCPGHILIFKSQLRSYKDLPIRYAELGTVYRRERSGVLHGMLRVRGFTQDDGHIFCTPEQLGDEVSGVVDFAIYMIKAFGYKDFRIKLSVRDPEHKEKYAGSDTEWEYAGDALRKTLDKKGLPFEIEKGGAVFYGPKIDIDLKDAIGRYWQGPTIQFDFNLPRRFNITYIDKNGEKKMVYMVHRALLGSLERFVGGLIEHYAGNFPLWLAPVQAKILTVTDAGVPFANKVYQNLRKHHLRVELDARNEKIGYKIREAENLKVPYMIIIGQREVDENKLSVRQHKKGEIGTFSVDEVIKILDEKINKEVEYRETL